MKVIFKLFCGLLSIFLTLPLVACSESGYAPHPPVVTGVNDQGGVHKNSSLLSIVSYKLDKAGMSPLEQGYYWLNVSLIMSPQSDYPMLAEMLPWVMR